jgi:hypothetical protein
MTRTPYCPLHKTLEGKHLEGKLSRRGIFARGILGGESSEENFQRGIFREEYSEGGNFADSHRVALRTPLAIFPLLCDWDDLDSILFSQVLHITISLTSIPG